MLREANFTKIWWEHLWQNKRINRRRN